MSTRRLLPGKEMGDGGSGGDVGGALYFEDSRFPMCAMRHTAFRLMGDDGQPQAYQPELRPRAGDLIVFPAWLRHGVRPYTGEGAHLHRHEYRCQGAPPMKFPAFGRAALLCAAGARACLRPHHA